ncbi:tail protein [Rubrivivax pictus]|uniref:Tail protein n=1 Tax=Pseudaquabacterium pictum TaxID=2315236 RepID=A0A480ATX0_9BURK|nr:tail protein [Rubrivivax pictus]
MPFFVDSHEAVLGRRGQVHEFPQRDTPYVEDLGRRARVFTVEAFVLGGDYMQTRNRLLQAIEQPGPGALVHPYMGEVRASLVDCKLREATAEGGMARITMQFVEAGTARFPTASVSTSAAVTASADFAAQAVQSNFERRYAVAGKPAFVAEASGNVFTSALGGMQGALSKVRGAADQVAKLQRMVDSYKRDLTTLIYVPASAAQALVGSIRQLVRSVATAPRDALSLARALYRFGSLLPPVAPNTTSRRAQAVAQAEMVRLVRVVAAAEGARAATGVVWESYQDAVTARNDLVDTLDEVMLSADLADEVYQALHALRTAVVRDVAARGADLARLVTWTPQGTVPSLALAQQLYANALREPELLQRNGVRHPLFVAGGVPLEVLADG